MFLPNGVSVSAGSKFQLSNGHGVVMLIRYQMGDGTWRYKDVITSQNLVVVAVNAAGIQKTIICLVPSGKPQHPNRPDHQHATYTQSNAPIDKVPFRQSGIINWCFLLVLLSTRNVDAPNTWSRQSSRLFHSKHLTKLTITRHY